MSATPGIVTLQIERASWDEDTNSFYADELGENALLTIRLSLDDASVAPDFKCDLSWREYGSIDVLGTKRVCTGQQYRRRAKSGGRVVSYGYSDLFEGVTRDEWMLYSKVFYAEAAYEFTCTYSDGNETATETFLLEEVPANMHLSGTGKGVAFGKFCASTEGNPMFECAYPAVFSENVAVAAGGLLKVVAVNAFSNASIESKSIKTATYTIPDSILGSGWTPVGVVGFYVNSRYVSVFEINLGSSPKNVAYAVYNGHAGDVTCTLEVHVLCLRTGL